MAYGGKRDFSRPRSAGYQYVLLEESVAPNTLSEYLDLYNGDAKILTPEQKEELLDLQEQLKKELWRLVDTELTKRQREVIRLRYSGVGMTQMKVARLLQINQSSVVKISSGNIDYKKELINGVVVVTKKYYGGAFKKLKKLVSLDETIQNILKKILELQG